MAFAFNLVLWKLIRQRNVACHVSKRFVPNIKKKKTGLPWRPEDFPVVEKLLTFTGFLIRLLLSVDYVAHLPYQSLWKSSY